MSHLTLDKRDFTESGNFTFVTECSSIGLRAGSPVPTAIAVPGLGNGQPFYPASADQHDGEVTGWRYKQALGCTTLLLIND